MGRRTGSCGILIVLVVFMGLGLLCGVVLDRLVVSYVAVPTQVPRDAAAEFGLMAQAWNVIDRVYVDRTAIQPITLTYGALSGMVDALGDTGHSVFLTPQMVAEESQFESGDYEGVGLEVQSKDGHVVIVAPMDGSPAQRAGLLAGDVIMKVDGQDVSQLPLSDVVARIVGPAGTQVTLTILNPTTNAMRDVTLKRETITIHNVAWQQLPGTRLAHLRLAAFSQDVTQDLRQALAEVEQAQLSGLVLDLRNNPGGLLDEAIKSASQFLSSGDVVLTKDVNGQITHVAVQPGGVALELPLVVLINGGTASGAEVMAGALQDAGRGSLVGETTFGTGTVLEQFKLPDGSALMLATQEWLTPKGRQIWHKGLAPDVAVTLDPGKSILLPEEEQGLTAAQLQDSGDAQLLRAIELLGVSQGKPSGASDLGGDRSAPLAAVLALRRIQG
jgi:carboxyl-terminal processing protease